MRTLVTAFDLADPVTELGGLKGYGRLLVLVHNGGQPLVQLSLPHDAGTDALASSEVLKAWRRQRESDPACNDRARISESAAPVVPVPVSVVVCTRDRPQLLQRCLDALMRLSYPEFEVIVVDNAPSSGASRAIVLETPFRYICEERTGLNWARNCGVRAATNEIIAFTDDDALADERWLWGLARGFGRSQVMAVTGLVLPAELETRAQRLYECYGTGMSRGLDARRFVPATLRARDLIETHRIGVGANMAFRREFLERLGGFDTALDAGTPAGGAGDLDMFHRVLAAGAEIGYEPSALVRHRHRDTVEALRQQLYDNGKSYGVYLRKLWQTHALQRRRLLAYVAGVWMPWLIGRIMRGIAGRHHLPVPLLWAEFSGFMHSGGAYRETYSRDARIRSGASG